MLPFTGWIAFTGLWCLYRSVGPLHYREAFKSPCDFYKSVWPLQIYVAFTGPCGLYRSVWSVQAHITFTGTCDFYRYVWPSLKSLKANTTYQCSHDYYYRKKDRDSSDIFFISRIFQLQSWHPDFAVPPLAVNRRTLLLVAFCLVPNPSQISVIRPSAMNDSCTLFRISKLFIFYCHETFIIRLRCLIRKAHGLVS